MDGIMKKVPHVATFKSESRTTRCIMSCVPNIGDLVRDVEQNGMGSGVVRKVYHGSLDNYIDIEWATNEALYGEKIYICKHTFEVIP